MLLFIPQDLGGSCKFSFGPKNALDFQSKVILGKPASNEIYKTFTETSLFHLLNFGSGTLVMFNIVQHYILEAI